MIFFFIGFPISLVLIVMQYPSLHFRYSNKHAMAVQGDEGLEGLQACHKSDQCGQKLSCF